MVCGDNEQTLMVLVAYYRQKIGSLIYNSNSEGNKIVQSSNGGSGAVSKVNNPQPKDFINLIREELNIANMDQFATIVDQIHYNSLIEHFHSWYDPSAPLIPDNIIESLIKLVESSFTYTSFMFGFDQILRGAWRIFLRVIIKNDLLASDTFYWCAALETQSSWYGQQW